MTGLWPVEKAVRPRPPRLGPFVWFVWFVGKFLRPPITACAMPVNTFPGDLIVADEIIFHHIFLWLWRSKTSMEARLRC